MLPSLLLPSALSTRRPRSPPFPSPALAHLAPALIHARLCSALPPTHPQTHLLPPNLLKLFAPRPPLPYAKPPGRDPDLPLKSLSARRAPQPIVVAPVLAQIRRDQDDRERKLVEEGVPPGTGEEQGEDLGTGDEVKDKAERAEVKIEEAVATAKAKQEGEEGADAKTADDKEEGEEEPSTAAKAQAVASASAASTQDARKPLGNHKADQPTDAVTIDLCAEEQFQLRRRERERRRKEAMSKPCASSLRLSLLPFPHMRA